MKTNKQTNKQTNKLLFGILAVAFVLAFTSCSDIQDDDNTPVEPPNSNSTPVAGDYLFGNLEQLPTPVSVTAVTITAKTGKSPGAVSNIRYNGSTTIPQTVGTYAVTFDVAAATGWNAANDLSAGNLNIAAIRRTGPGGGKIFYYDPAGFTMTDTAEICHFLEAALDNIMVTPAVTWASSCIDISTATGIGTGRNNTALILAAHPGDTALDNAAKACDSYSNNGETDWFLPSIDELNEIYQYIFLWDNDYAYLPTEFWSSSQYDSDSARATADPMEKIDKDITLHFCAIRAF